ncbi:MAG: DUF190 domain-containing protein [Prevotella sp.]|jgi:PII-like signaling protein|nr:DUF190 domain-containing protein [Prevotella sp.]
MSQKILRFYLSNTDTLNHESLYECIAREAKAFGLHGATVINGVMGFGETSQLRSNKFWELNIKHPMIVEMIDEEATLRAFITKMQPLLEGTEKGFLITLQDIEIVLKKQGHARK